MIIEAIECILSTIHVVLGLLFNLWIYIIALYNKDVILSYGIPSMFIYIPLFFVGYGVFRPFWHGGMRVLIFDYLDNFGDDNNE